MAEYRCSPPWSEWAKELAIWLHGRCRWRLPVLLTGLLFAQGRRTVASWLRAAGVSDGWKAYYYFISSIGCKSEWIWATQDFPMTRAGASCRRSNGYESRPRPGGALRIHRAPSGVEGRYGPAGCRPAEEASGQLR